MDQIVQDAWQAFEDKDYFKAKKLWQFAIDSNPEDEVLSGYCYTLCALKDFDEARRIYNSLWDKTNSHIYLHQLCMVEREAGNYEQALSFIHREAEILDQSNALVVAANLYEQGKLKQLMGEMNEALDIAKKCELSANRCDDLIMKACASRLLGEALATSNTEDSAQNMLKAASFFIKAKDEHGLSELLKSSNGIIIRKAKVEDVHKLHSIELENYGKDEATELETFQGIAQYINSKNSAGDYIFDLMCINGEVVGFYCCIIEKGVGSFADIAISKKWHGNKIGTLLMHNFLKTLPEDTSKIELEVRSSNLSAIKLYENFGFHETSLQKNYYTDGEDAVEMKLILPKVVS